jgi:hypothetical protein
MIYYMFFVNYDNRSWYDPFRETTAIHFNECIFQIQRNVGIYNV